MSQGASPNDHRGRGIDDDDDKNYLSYFRRISRNSVQMTKSLNETKTVQTANQTEHCVKKLSLDFTKQL